MKVKIAITVYKDKPLWDISARDQTMVDLSNKNDSEAIAKVSEGLFLKLLKVIKDAENKKKEKDNLTRSKGRNKEEEEEEEGQG